MPCATPIRAMRSSLLIALVATAACGRFGIGTSPETPSPARSDARMATVNVNVEPMLTHVSRYRAGPRHTYLRPAKGGGQQVSLEISALGTSIDIDPVRGPEGFRVIGVLENKSARYSEAEFDLKPRTRYLIWVGRGPMNSTNNSRTRWGLLEYPRTQKGVVPSQPRGYVLWCQNHPLPPGGVSDVDFRDLASCNVNVAARGPEEFKFATANFAPVGQPSNWSPIALPPIRDRVWFRCAIGCCQASFRF